LVFSNNKNPIEGFLASIILFNSTIIRSFVIMAKRGAFLAIAFKECSSISKFN